MNSRLPSGNTAPFPSRQILIAGCGYTGKRLADHWVAQQHRVAAITRSEQHAVQFRAAGIQPLLADLARAETLPYPGDPDVVVWAVGFDRSSADSRRAVWIDGLQRLLDALPRRQQPRRLLLTSSTSVYGDHEGRELDESVAPSPQSEAGQVCLEAEERLRQFAATNSDTAVILRLSGIYGPGRLLRRMEDLQQNRPSPADPEAWLNLVHVDDIVRLMHVLAFCDEPPALINVAGSRTPTRREYYSTLAELTGAPAPVFTMPAPAPSGRQPSGNRRITSYVRPELPLAFQFEDIRSGLAHCLQHSIE